MVLPPVASRQSTYASGASLICYTNGTPRCGKPKIRRLQQLEYIEPRGLLLPERKTREFMDLDRAATAITRLARLRSD